MTYEFERKLVHFGRRINIHEVRIKVNGFSRSYMITKQNIRNYCTLKCML